MKSKIQKMLNTCLLLLALSSCNSEKDCSKDFVVSYQRMGDAFEDLYKPLSGSFELNVLLESLNLFLASHKNQSCTYQGQKLNPTNEVEEMKTKLTAVEIDFSEDFVRAKTFRKSFGAKVIYGEDNRKEVAESSLRTQEWAASTMVQISPEKWDQNYNFIREVYGEEFQLCPETRFANQLSVGRCSGFLVAPDIIVTAGHCVRNQNECDSYRWVLDYIGNVEKTSADKVYQCEKIINQKLDDENELDYAVLKLNRPVKGRKFFRVRTSGEILVGTSLLLIGYPLGLPAKVAGGAEVRKNEKKHYFTTNTDSFLGNSGSAVINPIDGVVEGLLVRGDDDFVFVNGPDGKRCRTERRCPSKGCAGEDVTKMTSVEGIPLIADPIAIRKGFYEDKNFPVMTDGFSLGFLSYSYGGYTLGGLKFLDRCGVHYFENSTPEKWEDFYKGSCNPAAKIDDVINSFSGLFYL